MLKISLSSLLKIASSSSFERVKALTRIPDKFRPHFLLGKFNFVVQIILQTFESHLIASLGNKKDMVGAGNDSVPESEILVFSSTSILVFILSFSNLFHPAKLLKIVKSYLIAHLPFQI